MMRRRNGEPAGNNNNGHHLHNSAGGVRAGAGADGFGPDAALMGFHGAGDAGSSAYSSPSRTSDGGFSSVSGGPLHLASHHQPNKLYVSSPAPGVGLSGSGYRGGGGGPMEEMGDRTPLFGAPPAGAGFDARYARHGHGSVSALRSARSRDRRRLMGRLAVRATQPAALMVLAGVALVLMMTTTSWSGSGGGAVTTTRLSAGTPAAGTTMGKVLTATAATAASGGAAEMLAEAAVDVLSQAAAFGSTGGADGTSTSSHGNIKVVQPENLGSTADASAEVAAPAAAASSTATTSVDSPAKGEAGVIWLLDKDGNKKVVLVPRDSDKKKAVAAGTTTASSNTQAATKLQQKQSLLQKLGLTRKKDHKKQQQQQQQQKATEATGTSAAATSADASSASDVVTYYYDSVVPQTAMTSTGAASTAASAGTGPGQEAPMAAVPEVVYDKMGNAVKLVDLHNVGAAAPSTAEQSSPVLASAADDAINAVADALPSNANAVAKVAKTSPTAKTMAAEEVTGAALTSPATAATTAVAATKSMANTLAGASSLEADGTTNQLIVIATVATMALFGGALVARRMRTRNFLNSCIENESLEDELAYDAANTTLGAAVGYDTFSAVGDMKWKGDLEKFDV